LLVSNGSRLEKTLELMGVRSFTTEDAVVSSRVQRLASYGQMTDATGTYDQLNCIDREAFPAKGGLSECGDGVCAAGVETATSWPIDCDHAPSPSAPVLTNLALGKPATQSSVGWGGVPERAVDGNTDGGAEALITHTATNSTGNWWRVDLGAS